ncbi:pilin [Pseudomonas sp. URMO17WK12:I4]|uniref:pilin n=1 Tax=Pseudomonas sp. URMO17WK12:I4 TaxID=1283292 RepID=UPI003529AA61
MVSLDGSGGIVLMVTLGGRASSDLAGTRASLIRSAEGGWHCLIEPIAASGWKDVYSPEGCRS